MDPALDLAILADEVGGQAGEPVGIGNDGRHEVNDGRREGGIAGGKLLLALGPGDVLLRTVETPSKVAV